MEIKDVGQRITKLRKENGWSQMMLAEKLNVSDKTVSKWENGGMPGIDLFPKLAQLFNVSIDYLMTGKEDTNVVDNNKTDDASEDNTKVEKTPAKPAIVRVCSKCNKENHNPGTHCAFCYHEFDSSDEERQIVKEEPMVEPEEIVIKYDENNKPICPKCNRANPYLDTHCVFCYHDFTRKVRPNTNNGRSFYNNGNNGAKPYSGVSAAQNVTYRTAPTSQVGCLAYLIALLFPIIGLIWGAVKGEKGLVIFSIANIVISMFVYFVLVLCGVLMAAP